MPKIRRFATRTIHDVPLVFEDEAGKRIEEKFAVTYLSYSNKALDHMAAAQEAARKAGPEPATPDGAGVRLSVLVGLTVVSITDKEGYPLTDDQGETATLTTEFFEGMALDNVRAIYDAIQADINPPKASSEPGPSGSAAAASEA